MCFLRFGLVGLGWSRMGIEEHVVLFSFLFFLFLVVFIIVLIVKNIKVTILPFYTLLKLWSTSIFLVKYWTRGWKLSFSHMRMKDLRTWELQMKGKSKSCKNLKLWLQLSLQLIIFMLIILKYVGMINLSRW